MHLKTLISFHQTAKGSMAKLRTSAFQRLFSIINAFESVPMLKKRVILRASLLWEINKKV